METSDRLDSDHALAALGLPCVPGPPQLRGRGSGQPPGAKVPERQVRLGRPPAAFGPQVRQHRGDCQVLDPAARASMSIANTDLTLHAWARSAPARQVNSG
jgi:hypothetical protein